jgi:hypothetical protein
VRTEDTDRGDATDVDAPVHREVPTADGGDAVAPAATRRRPPSRAAWVVATVAILVAIVATVVAVVLWQQQRGTAAAIDQVETSAGSFALALTTWDASDGMADTREQLREAGTETFAGDVDQLFGGTDDLATLEEIGARSEGEVQDVLVQRVEGDEAEALAVVVQRVTTDITDGEEVSLRYARLGLLRDGGTWRIDSVDLIVDALQETAARSDLGQLSDAAGADGEGEG